MSAHRVIGCVVMASGVGQRFGGSNKLLTSLAGQPLVLCSAQSVPQSLFDMVVSTRWAEVARLCELHAIPSVLHSNITRSGSLQAGLMWGASRGWEGCLFLPGDQPLVQKESFQKLAQGFHQNPLAIHRLAWNDNPGSPILFPARLFHQLGLLERSQGGRKAIGKQEQMLCHQAHYAYELWDVDTPYDKKKIVELFDVLHEKK